MGIVSFMETRAQREILKRAVEAAWAASTGIGMVFGPLTLAMEHGAASQSELNRLIDEWLAKWASVRYLSDRNIHRNRDYYEVRPNERLSPILLDFDSRLRAIRASQYAGSTEMVAAVKDAYTETILELKQFLDWARSAGPSVGLDYSKFETVAGTKGQKYWGPTLRELQV